MASRRPPGRPRKRTDRWYALLGLIYCIADELAKNTDEIDERETGHSRRIVRGPTGVVEHRSRPLPATAHNITLETIGYELKRKAVNNALTQAKERGLLGGSKFEHRTSSHRRMTERGWEALGAPPQAWVEQFGPEWKLVVSDRAAMHAALDVLGAEFQSEHGQ